MNSGAPPPLGCDDALFIDVDGTLLEIAPSPELVRVPDFLPGLLECLAAQRGGALALVSGRPIADLDRLFRPWRGAAAGLHGAERRSGNGFCETAGDRAADRQAAAALDRMRPVLSDLTGRIPGVRLEDKGRTLAVHYRAAPEQGPRILSEMEQLAGAEDGLRLIAGKMVVELQPCHHGKHRAIAAFMAETPFVGRFPVFLGDDTTDEDGFAEVNRRGGISIRVGGERPGTAAGYTLPSVTATLDWLRAGAERGRHR